MPSEKTKQRLKEIGTNTLLKALYSWIAAFGFDILKFVDAVRGFPAVLSDYVSFKRLLAPDKGRWPINLSMPCLEDKYASSGVTKRHYFHQDLLVARRIHERNPRKHVDVASRVDGFVAHVAAFRELEVFDIRPLEVKVPNITFRQSDLMSSQVEFTEYCDSLSCLHALEHFGLGRYGDRIDIDGHRRGFENLSKILQKNGILYLSVPIGDQRIDFNAHRVFAISTVLDMVKDKFELIGFSYVDDRGDLHENVLLHGEQIASNLGCYYGCGIFELRKLR
jgi:hypothetical protein